MRLMDGVLPVVSVTLWQDSPAKKRFEPTRVCQIDSYWKLSKPVCRRQEEIQPGLRFSGRYHCHPTAVVNLCDRLAVSAPASLVQALLWGSYFAGMDLPGQSAFIFSALARFQRPMGEQECL